MRVLLGRFEVREALFLASPALDERLHVWENDPESEDGLRLEAALVKYLYRMASRCTPFGLFAGNSVGSLGAATVLELQGAAAAVRQTRLDMEYLETLVHRLASDPRTRPLLPFTVNSSLYEVAGRMRYAEARSTGDPSGATGRRAYFLVDVEPHDHLRRILERAHQPASLDTLAKAAVDDDVSFDEARAFVEELVAAGILVPDLGPNVTGPDATGDLVVRLMAIEAAPGDEALRHVTRALARISTQLATMDEDGPGIAPVRYRRLAAEAAALAPVELARFVQLDLVNPARQVTVARRILDDLDAGVRLLLDLFAQGQASPLAEFRRAFEERYGETDVPLAEALDEEFGIGFQTSRNPGAEAAPLLAGLPFPPLLEEERVVWGARHRYLEWKVAETIAAGRDELVLGPDDVARLRRDPSPRLADAYHIHATLLADDGSAGGPRVVLESAGGPSGVRFLGRFCHADLELERRVTEHIRAEEALDPDVRYFEVVHLPEGRIGNILARPVFRELELEYLGASGAPRDRVLHIDDLVVGIRRDRIVLLSRRLGCEVRPRITSAHNVAWRSLGIYRFLAALQAEGCIEGVIWTWGPLGSQPRLPRIRLGAVVLVRAQWNVPRSEIRSLTAHAGHAGFVATQAWRERRSLPRWIGLIDQDNVLTVDLEHPLSVAAFLHELRGREEAVLQEVFPGARTDVVTAPEGRFVNEVLLPVVRPRRNRPEPHRGAGDATRPAAAATTAHAPRPDGVTQAASSVPAIRELPAAGRIFPPGSSWLTVKLYAGPSGLDEVLTELAAPIASWAQEQEITDRWFFLRYADPDWHLRIRYHGDPKRLLAELLPRLTAAAAPYLDDRRIHRIQLDTYTRETVRYGGPAAIESAEAVFHADSVLVANYLAALQDDAGEADRWRFAFLACDQLLGDLGFGLTAKRILAGRLAALFAEEFETDAALRKALRDRYRTERAALTASVQDARSAGLLRHRSAAIAAPCRRLRELADANALTEPIEEIAGSLLHMHANRIFREASRAQEMVIYRFLEKTYASLEARHVSPPAAPGRPAGLPPREEDA